MNYIISEEDKQFLVQTYSLLNEIELKGQKNLSALVGSLMRIEQILKNLRELKEVPKEE